jgi:hypothetical protein
LATAKQQASSSPAAPLPFYFSLRQKDKFPQTPPISNPFALRIQPIFLFSRPLIPSAQPPSLECGFLEQLPRPKSLEPKGALLDIIIVLHGTYRFK